MSIDPDDAPEWMDDDFAKAEVRSGDVILRPAAGVLKARGRPRLATPKRQVTLRLDEDIIDRFRKTGPGWQSRINDILKKA